MRRLLSGVGAAVHHKFHPVDAAGPIGAEPDGGMGDFTGIHHAHHGILFHQVLISGRIPVSGRARIVFHADLPIHGLPGLAEKHIIADSSALDLKNMPEELRRYFPERR